MRPNTDLSGAVLPAAGDAVGPPSVFPSYTLIWQYQHISSYLSIQLTAANCDCTVPPQTDSTAQHTSHLMLSQCGAARARKLRPGGPIAVKPPTNFLPMAGYFRGGRGTTSRLPGLDALSNCCLCTIALFFLLSECVSGLVPAVWQSMLSWYMSWTQLPFWGPFVDLTIDMAYTDLWFE